LQFWNKYLLSYADEEKWMLENDWDKTQLKDAVDVAGPPVNIERERVVVVTGVSSGIGLATVKSLLNQDCHVFGRYALFTSALPSSSRTGITC
jgi:hypothetical protein